MPDKLDKTEENIKNYLNFYKKIVPEFTKEELNFIKEKLEFKTFKKNEYYLQQGEVQRKLGFVSKGLFRQFYTDEKGKEITVNFSPENVFTTDYSSFINQEPSNYGIQALEDGTIIDLDYNIIQEGYAKYKNYERFGRLIIEYIFMERQKRIERLLFQNAEERYLHFIKAHPNLFNRVSLSHLSTYLGIERQSLSRIRKKIVS